MSLTDSFGFELEILGRVVHSLYLVNASWSCLDEPASRGAAREPRSA